MNLKATISQNPVASFIILVLILYLVAFLLPAPPEGAFTQVVLLALMIPTVAALVLVAIMEGQLGLGVFLRQTFRWRSPLKWYLIALALGLTIPLVSNILALLTGRILTIELTAPTALFVVYPLFALLEDIGWRGFALRRLLDQQSPFIASLIVGVPWGLVHLALGVVFQPEVSPLSWGLSVLASAFPLTWIFVRSQRNVLVSVVLHASINVFVGTLVAAIPAAQIYWLLFAGTCLVTAVLVMIDKRIWFARPVARVSEATPYAAKDGLSIGA